MIIICSYTINNADVTKNLKPLQLRRNIASLCVFYLLYHNSEESFKFIPSSLFFYKNTKTGLWSHGVAHHGSSNKFVNFYLCRTVQMRNDSPGLHRRPPMKGMSLTVTVIEPFRIYHQVVWSFLPSYYKIIIIYVNIEIKKNTH